MIRLIVGLGNPGEQYTKTRHNAGFWLLDALAKRYGAHFSLEKKFQAACAKVAIKHHSVYLAKPQTFMNASGRSVAALANFYHLAADEILVVHDELAIPEGALRLKFGGGHAGHNGLRDIISALGSKDFYRLRMGIDHPGNAKAVVNYVLSSPSKEALLQFDEKMPRALEAVERLVDEGSERATHWLHNLEKE